MAKLVIGTDKTTGVPALVKEVGITPTGTINITQNGIVDVTNYASANVATPAAPDYYVGYIKDSNGVMQHDGNMISFNGIKKITTTGMFAYTYCEDTTYSGAVDMSSIEEVTAGYVFQMFMNDSANKTSVDLSGLKIVSGNNAFYSAFCQSRDLTSVDLSGLTSVGSVGYNNGNEFYKAFYNSPLTGFLDLSSLTTIGSYQAFSQAFQKTHITGVDLRNITEANTESVFKYAFAECTYLGSFNFSSLQQITANQGLNRCFSSCTSLTSGSFPALTKVSSQWGLLGCFENCSALTSMTFPLLSEISGDSCMSTTFLNCTLMTDLRFPALSNVGSKTNQFKNMLQGVTGCTVHFPSNMQSVIGSWPDVTNGFGGTNTTVLFDLPATE